MANIMYNNFPEHLGNGDFDMDADTFYGVLLTSSYTPLATEEAYSDLTSEVGNGNGYATGGKALTSPTWVESAGVTTFDAADLEWAASTYTCRYLAIYNYTSAGNYLVCLLDPGEDKSPNAATFKVQFHANGILTINVAA